MYIGLADMIIIIYYINPKRRMNARKRPTLYDHHLLVPPVIVCILAAIAISAYDPDNLVHCSTIQDDRVKATF